MSLHGPSPCWCCGQLESTKGCVRGHRCICGLGYAGSVCNGCGFCKHHCQCTEEMKQLVSAAHEKFIEALKLIHQANPNHFNRGQGLPDWQSRVFPKSRQL